MGGLKAGAKASTAARARTKDVAVESFIFSFWMDLTVKMEKL